MLEKRTDWGDRVRILGVSIDQGTDVVKTHVKSKKWEKVDHKFNGSSSSD